MVSKEMKLFMGEKLYVLKNGEAIYNYAQSYADDYIETEDREKGQIYLDLLYIAFMEGYISESVCYDIGLMVNDGFLISGHNESESINLAAAILQFAVERCESGMCAALISSMYENGTTGYIQKDGNLAWEWLFRAAQLGDSEAQLVVGTHFYKNMRKPYDAEMWWLASAENGNEKAMYNLGVLYESSAFCDYPRAGEWFQLAAENGIVEAEEILRRSYEYSQRHQKWLKRI